MKNHFFRISPALLLVVCISMFGYKAAAQVQQKDQPFRKHFYVQPNLGLSQYLGDINADDLYNRNPKLGFGAALGYQLSPVLGLRADLSKMKLYSEKPSLDKKLTSDLLDLGLGLTLNINELFGEYNPNRFANFYLLGGAGFASYKSKLEKIGTAVTLNDPGRKSEFVIPFGGGAALRLTDNVKLSLEYVTRVMFNDDKIDFTAAQQKHDLYSLATAGLKVDLGCKDTDGDGIKDKEDACPEIPGKLELMGCPDRDNDGIADKDDLCPDVAGKIDFKGCPDTDGDGIPDKDDACPTQIGKSDLNGCPDTDGDGIADKDDKCPKEFGLKALNGCPDRDSDGIADIDDACPDVKGLAQLKGCPDTDGDGVADKDDSCPTVAGPAKLNGCPDTDGDGVPDNLDKCPTVIGVAANKGCPEVLPQTQKIFEQAIKGIQFETNSDVIRPVSFTILNQVVKVMKDNPAYLLGINGHTDNVGDDAKNMDLSQRRAEAVKKYLVNKGIEGSRLTPKGFGETVPVADNNTAAGRALNRRVEFKVNF